MKYFSKTTRGFYDDDLHGNNMPIDAVAVSPERFSELWDGHLLGKIIVGDEHGNPILNDPIQISLNYAQLRESAYPPIEDFADAWVKNDEQGLEEYRQKCLAVKAKYPK